jgi:hypothetical protein
MMEKDAILTNFLEQGKCDDRLLPTHLALFTAMHHLLKKAGSEISVRVTRKNIMRLAKIKSISTYHRCVNELVTFNYIIYRPSFDHHLGTLVTFKIDTPKKYVL